IVVKTVKYYQIINLNNYNNSEIKRAVLDRTMVFYNRILVTFNNFLKLYPEVFWLLNICFYKRFIKFVSKNIPGRLEIYFIFKNSRIFLLLI
ncbi:uncharacterized protein BO72DRAFT_371756, partial [Aspergillus fijiensis CBS 313.89]